MNIPNNDAWNPRRNQSMRSTEGGVMVEDAKDASRSTPSISRLLLIDDDTALLTALSAIIEFHLGPVRFDTCDSGTKALDLVRANRYDAIIVDMNMPSMSGLEFLVAVKQLRRDIPVLMISGHANDALIASALEAGASDFIPKPFDRNQIVSAVRHGLELSRSSA
jgi:two-component system, NtrC family, nitrogen regulation response regulator NtrX